MVNSHVKELSSMSPHCNDTNKTKNLTKLKPGLLRLVGKEPPLLISLNLSVKYMDFHPTKGKTRH